MRSYDDVVEVRRGVVGGREVPEQFLWHGRLWKVREVLSHWVETGAWWERAGVAELFGRDRDQRGGAAQVSDLLAEREHWRVEASRGRWVDAAGVFELAFDWSDGTWRLVGCMD